MDNEEKYKFISENRIKNKHPHASRHYKTKSRTDPLALQITRDRD